MKIRIIDLMDYYYGDHAKPDMAAIPGEASGAPRKQQGDVVKMGRRPRPLLVAAALLLVVTGGVALRLGLGHSPEGQAMNEGNSVVENIQETMAPELPAVVPESGVETEGAVLQTPSDLLQPSVLEGQWTYEENMYCEGNLFVLGGSFYTMTDNGPESIEMQNLNTTVDFHGTWEVDIDYAVIDGELVFRNNTDKNDYTIVNGEKMTPFEYEEWKWEQMGVSEDVPILERPVVDTSEVEWITPQVAIAWLLEGSADTVMLTVRRTDIDYMDNTRYPFFYNIFTGEITDPLANVPGLLDHGQFGGVIFNSALTRAMVDLWGVPYSDGSVGNRTYVCDLVTGEMEPVTDLLEPLLPDSGVEGTSWYENGLYNAWVDDDAFVFHMIESIPQGNVEEMTDEEILEKDPWERNIWQFVYNVAEGTLRYSEKQVGSDTFTLRKGNGDYNVRYLLNHDYENARYGIVDTATGESYTLDIPTGDYGGNGYDLSEHQYLLRSGASYYLVDTTQMGYVDLGAYFALPEQEITEVQMVTDGWVCLITADKLYFYKVPADISMTPWTKD